MQKAIKITENIYWIGGNDCETDLFEGLWTLPQEYLTMLILSMTTKRRS